MAAAVATSLVGDLHDPEYVNWLKSNRALHCTIDVLRDVCLTEIKKFHTSLLSKHGRTPCSTICTHKDVTYHRWANDWSIPCHVCSQWLVDIVREKFKKSTTLFWQNSDFSQWQTEPWQIAKMFMERQDTACVSPADTDTAGILQFLMNCKLFKKMVTWKKLDSVSPCSFQSLFFSLECKNRCPDAHIYLTVYTHLIWQSWLLDLGHCYYAQ